MKKAGLQRLSYMSCLSTRLLFGIGICGLLLLGTAGVVLLILGGNTLPNSLDPSELNTEDGRRLTPEEQTLKLQTKVLTSSGFYMAVLGGTLVAFVSLVGGIGVLFFSCCAPRFYGSPRRVRIAPFTEPPPALSSEPTVHPRRHSVPTTDVPPPTSDSISLQIYPLQVPSPRADQRT